VAKKTVTKKVKKIKTTPVIVAGTIISSSEPSKAPQIGDVVPNFSIPSTAGQDFVLNNYQGKKVVLYFYPKDSTPGCTTEGYEFSGLQDQFKNQNTEIFGISRNSLLSHDKFKDEQSLT